MSHGGGTGEAVQKGEAASLSIAHNGRRDCTGVGRHGHEVKSRSSDGDTGACLKTAKARTGLVLETSGDKCQSHGARLLRDREWM